ncbi:hypothetical protein YPPY63_2666, partial [Yersinia pestis PY-63]
MFCGGGAR